MKAYIKDCNDINGRTKAFIKIISGNVKEDRLTTANSSFTCDKMPDDINIGDIFILVNDKGLFMYYGKITSIQDNTINTSQIINILEGTFIYSIVDELKQSSPSTYLEQEIVKVLNNYKSGKLYRSSYTDTMIAQEIGGLSITSVNSITSLLPSDKDKDGNEQLTSKKVVSWLYELYENYGIAIDFVIPTQVGTTSIKVWKPNYTGIKISDGFECISSIVPKSEEQSINKLVIYSKDKTTYRDTYVLTTNGIVQHPSSTAGRSNKINTKIVFSDDNINDIVSANLSPTLYNHKIEFNVKLNTNLFKFEDLKLDLPIQVYSKDSYYSSIITGKEFSFSNDVINSLKLICGNVRTTLTSKISMGLL